MFCRGDLNYRIDLPRSIVKANIRSGNLDLLLEHDQLRKEMASNQSFRLRSFKEADITFPPTYKFDPGTDDHDTSEKERIPAWCDRILYRTSSRPPPPALSSFGPSPQTTGNQNHSSNRRSPSDNHEKRERENGALLASADQERIKALAYRSWSANVSDHKPITGLFLVKIKKMDIKKRAHAWEQAEAAWREREHGLLLDAMRYHT